MRSAATFWGLRGGVVVALLAGLMVADWIVSDLHKEVSQVRQRFETIPDEILYAAKVESELERRAFDIDRIGSFVPQREDIIEVVSAIEQEGVGRGVTVRVRNIEEVFVIDEGGQPVVPEGPIRDIRVEVIAFGEPDELVEFLYKVEHMPYLLHFDSWDLKVEPVKSGQGLGVGSGAASGSVIAPAHLAADVIISVEKGEDAR